MSLGKVVLVGAGPGEIDLLTLKAKKYIEQADCIVYDRLVNKKILSLTKQSCEKIFVGKANHNHTLPQDKINELLLDKATDYHLIVRLKGGDPYVFGRGGEEALFLREHGIAVDVVPGISSSIATLSAAGIPITHRGLSKGFQVITAHSKRDTVADIDYSKLSDESVTLVFLMGLSHVGEIADGLISVGRATDTPAAVISNGTTNRQKVVKGTLSDINKKVSEAGLVSPATIVVGDVVGLSDNLNFFEKRPLFGRKYFLPIIQKCDYSLGNAFEKTTNELETMLGAAGAEVVTVTAGTISFVECDLSFLTDLNQEDYIVFTSGNGVKAFFWNLFEIMGADIRAVSHVKFAAIGEKTASVLKSFGIIADIISLKQNGKGLAELINNVEPSSYRLHWMCQKNTSTDFENNINEKFSLIKHVCYENIPEQLVPSEELLSEISTCDGAIFTCASNAAFALEHFRSSMPNETYSIGPACTSKIKEYGITSIHEARNSSYDGIMSILANKDI